MMNTDKLKELLAAATPGPWKIGNCGPLLFGAQRGPGTEPIGFVYGPTVPQDSDVYRRATADAALIVAAVNALPSLLARLEAAEKVVEAGDNAAKVLHNVIEAWVPIQHREAFRRDASGLDDALTTYDQEKARG